MHVSSKEIAPHETSYSTMWHALFLHLTCQNKPNMIEKQRNKANCIEWASPVLEFLALLGGKITHQLGFAWTMEDTLCS